VSPSLAKTPTPFSQAMLRCYGGLRLVILGSLPLCLRTCHCILLVLRLGQWSCSLRNGVAAKQSVSLDLSCMKALLSSSIYCIYLSISNSTDDRTSEQKKRKETKEIQNKPSVFLPSPDINIVTKFVILVYQPIPTRHSTKSDAFGNVSGGRFSTLIANCGRNVGWRGYGVLFTIETPSPCVKNTPMHAASPCISKPRLVAVEKARMPNILVKI